MFINFLFLMTHTTKAFSFKSTIVVIGLSKNTGRYLPMQRSRSKYCTAYTSNFNFNYLEISMALTTDTLQETKQLLPPMSSQEVILTSNSVSMTYVAMWYHVQELSTQYELSPQQFIYVVLTSVFVTCLIVADVVG